MRRLEPATAIRNKEKEEAIVRDCMAHGLTEEQARLVLADSLKDDLFLNDTYQVARRRVDANWIHLSIKRRDQQPCNDWRDFQAIKNQLVGPDHEGIQLYPAEERVVDTANQYHIWVLADPKVRLPVGWDTGLKSDKFAADTGIQQRRF